MIKKTLIASIRSYKKYISPLVGRGFNGCRFYPSCSDYAVAAIEKNGVVKGAVISAKRILRCSPLSVGGVDELK